ncbi:DUF6538 domain-containing protein [Azospirillum canadense]|uniref:DUF6538 domain-containing protein n=1 Tax=Azospirillum canadense TaxID=403962 RepID=UPI003872B3D7|nr:hypothetical protein [Azospirillum canadense]
MPAHCRTAVCHAPPRTRSSRRLAKSDRQCQPTILIEGYMSILLGSTITCVPIDLVGKSAPDGALNPVCDTALSHAASAESPPSPSKSAVSARPGCRTSLSPKRRPTGLWMRGAVWQYRTRVPADLHAVLGRSHINRSLRTSSYPDAIRAARRIAFEIEQEFDAARGGAGSDPADAACDRACPPPSVPSVTADAVSALFGIPFAVLDLNI